MNHLLDSFLQWLASASLRASGLAIAVLALQLILGRWLPARWRHALWLPVVLVLLAPALPSSRLSVQNRLPAGSSAVAAPSMTELSSTVATPAVPPPTGISGRQALFATWLLGTCSVLVAGGLGYRRSLRRIGRGMVPAGAETEAAVAELAQALGLRKAPRVVMSSAVESPAVAGLWQPTLLLPANFPEGFSEAEARIVLRHELTHLKRRDLPLNWLLCVLQAMHWFNPLLWFVFARMRTDRETACDADVLSADPEDRRAEYGHALLKLQACAPSSGLSLAFVGIFARAGIRSRLCAIASHRRSSSAWSFAGALLIAVLTLAGATRAQSDSTNKGVWGAFVSFSEGTLTLKVAGGELAIKNVGEPTKVFAFDRASRAMKPANPVEALGKAEPGAWIFVAPNREYIRIGAAKEGHTTGTFVSYKDGRLLLLGKDLPVSSYTKKYGNNLNYPMSDQTLPVFESIDGGEYTLAGTPAAAFAKVQEGTLVTVYFGPNDGFFIRAEVGMKKQP